MKCYSLLYNTDAPSIQQQHKSLALSTIWTGQETTCNPWDASHKPKCGIYCVVYLRNYLYLQASLNMQTGRCSVVALLSSIIKHVWVMSVCRFSFLFLGIGFYVWQRSQGGREWMTSCLCWNQTLALPGELLSLILKLIWCRTVEWKRKIIKHFYYR